MYANVTQALEEAQAKLPEGAVLHYTILPVAPSSVQAGRDSGGNILGLEKVSQTCMLRLLLPESQLIALYRVGLRP